MQSNNYYPSYEEPHKSRAASVVVGVVLLLAVGAGLIYLYRLGHRKLVPAPTSYISVQAPDQSFVVDAPVGWHTGSASAEAISSDVTMTKGLATVRVSANLAGSLVADMQQAQNNQLENMASLAGTPPVKETAPVEKVHETNEPGVASQFDDYAEQPMQTVTGKMGDGRMSEFTAQGGEFVGPLRGYRATFLDSQSAISVIVDCPQRNWAILQPAFMHIIQSVGPDQTR